MAKVYLPPVRNPFQRRGARDKAVAVRRVVELAQVARVIIPGGSPLTQRGAGDGIVAIDPQVLIEGEVSVEPEGRVGARLLGEGRIPVGGDDSNIAASQDVTPDAENRKVGGREQRIVSHPARLDVQGADTVGAGAAGHPASGPDGVDAFFRQADAAAEKDDGCEHVPESSGGSSERKNRLALEEKIALLGEKQSEARQVNLLLIFLDPMLAKK